MAIRQLINNCFTPLPTRLTKMVKFKTFRPLGETSFCYLNHAIEILLLNIADLIWLLIICYTKRTPYDAFVLR